MPTTDQLAVDRVRTHLQFGVAGTQTWVYALELERELGLPRATVEAAMGLLEREYPWLEREERAGELRWRLPEGLA